MCIPGRHADQPQEVADFFRQARRADGAAWSSATSTAPSSTRTRLLRLADTGCVIEFDLFGQEQSYYYAFRYRHAERRHPPAADAQR